MRTLFLKISTFVSVVCFSFATAQVNLVPNPSFEIYDTCPDLTTKISYAVGWYNPNLHSPDYHNSCSPSLYYSTPVNFIGNQSPQTGTGYAGIGVAGYNGSREYIAIQLTSPLMSNTSYYVEFFVSLADSCNCSSDNLGVCFSPSPLLETSIDSINCYPSVINPLGNFINDKTSWVKFSGYFKALGGEQYLTLGNFNGTATTNTIAVANGGLASNPNFDGAYLYIDDITVIDSAYVGVVDIEQDSEIKIIVHHSALEFQLGNNQINNVKFYNSVGELLDEKVQLTKESTFYFSTVGLAKQVCFITYETKNKLITRKILIE